VTSNSTLDSQGEGARSWLMERADLVGAIRLPKTAFQKNANTEVTTDIIVLRKKEGAALPGSAAVPARKGGGNQ
jgi:adenine-specific DNA methylase